MPTVMQWIAAVLGVGGGGKFIWEIFTVRSQAKKNSSESTVLLVNSATGYADSVAKQLDSLNHRFDEFRKDQEAKNDEQDRRNREQDRLLFAHSRWDHEVAALLRQKGVQVAEPPPLFLPEGTKS